MSTPYPHYSRQDGGSSEVTVVQSLTLEGLLLRHRISTGVGIMDCVTDPSPSLNS